MAGLPLPADASPRPHDRTAHGSGPMWFAIPSSQWTCTTYSSPASRRTVTRCRPRHVSSPRLVERSMRISRTRSPVCFTSRVMGPIRPGRLSARVEPLGTSEFGTATPYSTAPSRSPVGSGLAELPGRLSLRLDVYSPPQVLQIDGRLCHLVLAFLLVGDSTNSRAPSLHGRYPASTLLRTHPSPSRLRSTSRLSRLYDRPCSDDFSSGQGGLLQLLGMSLSPCCRSHPAEVLEPHRSDFGSPCRLCPPVGARPSGLLTFEATFAFTVVTAR